MLKNNRSESSSCTAANSQELLAPAIAVLHNGGVIAYPTEHCFGLGCDPANQAAVQRILDIKRRSVSQGLILIAAEYTHIEAYANLVDAAMIESIRESWPGPVTWLLQKRPAVEPWLSGDHESIAMRITAHEYSRQLCLGFGGAIVSTSANRHGKAACLDAEQVRAEMGSEIDFIVDAPVGGAESASQIRDAETGKQLR